MNTRPTGLIEKHERRSRFEGGHHHVHYFVRMHLTCGAAEDREILASNVYISTIAGSNARNHTVGRGFLTCHPEIGTAVSREHSELLEGHRVQEISNSLTRGHLAGGSLLVELVLPTTERYFGFSLAEFFDLCLVFGCGLHSKSPGRNAALRQVRPEWLRASLLKWDIERDLESGKVFVNFPFQGLHPALSHVRSEHF